MALRFPQIRVGKHMRSKEAENRSLWIEQRRARHGAGDRLGDLLFRQLAPDVGPRLLVTPGWLRCFLHITISLCRSLKPAMKQDAESGGAVHALIPGAPFIDLRRKLFGYA